MSLEESKKKYIEMLRKNADLRKLIGLKAYSQVDILKMVKSDLNHNLYIEAYSVADQYIESLIKKLFDDGTKKYWERERFFSVAGALRSSLFFGKSSKNLLDEYLHFKDKRDKLIHHVVFNQKGYKSFKDLKTIKNRPLKIIPIVESFFEERMKEYLADTNRWTQVCKGKSFKEKKDYYKKMMTYLIDFKIKILVERQGMSIKDVQKKILEELKGVAVNYIKWIDIHSGKK